MLRERLVQIARRCRAGLLSHNSLDRLAGAEEQKIQFLVVGMQHLGNFRKSKRSTLLRQKGDL